MALRLVPSLPALQGLDLHAGIQPWDPYHVGAETEVEVGLVAQLVKAPGGKLAGNCIPSRISFLQWRSGVRIPSRRQKMKADVRAR